MQVTDVLICLMAIFNDLITIEAILIINLIFNE